MKLSKIALTGSFLLAGTVAASAASVDKSIEVKAPAEKVWAMIGPFCSIKDWHPAIGKCTEEGKSRTLLTKDGKMTFNETQTASDDKGFSYEYRIDKSPLPVTDYKSTLKVTPKGKDSSTVEWSSTFTPASGKEKDAESAISGIYQAGLDNIAKAAGK